MSRLLFFLLSLAAPVLARAGVHMFARMPAAPFLALTPARTAIGRSVSVAMLVAGLLGLSALLSLSTRFWLLVGAFAPAVCVVVGCGRAFATFWWPAALAAAPISMGSALALLPRLTPWALRIDPNSEHMAILFFGGWTGLVWLAYLTTGLTAGAMQQLETAVSRKGKESARGGS